MDSRGLFGCRCHIDTLFYVACAVIASGYSFGDCCAQALLNILSNAKDVLIDRQIQDPFIRMSVRHGEKYSLINIEDNGGGIAPEYLERIFEPYFTTKHAKQGTGIGLYMTKMIIENNMNGIIVVKNTEAGVLFTIKLKLFHEI